MQTDSIRIGRLCQAMNRLRYGLSATMVEGASDDERAISASAFQAFCDRLDCIPGLAQGSDPGFRICPRWGREQ